MSALETPCAACTPLATAHGTSHALGRALSPFLSAGQVRALITQELMAMQTCLGEALLLSKGAGKVSKSLLITPDESMSLMLASGCA